MHRKSTSAPADDLYAILQLVDYSGVGDYAWVRSEEPLEDDDAIYVLTDKGRRDLRAAELFGCRPDDD